LLTRRFRAGLPFAIFHSPFAIFNFCLLLILLATSPVTAEDSTWIYTVQISSNIQSSPPQITLQWEANDLYGVRSWSIYRKAKEATSWDFLTSLGPDVTNWTDSSVSAGSTYEYQIIKAATNHTGYGYIFSGINAPLTDSRC